tara:strand:- start:37110 stop:37523 length:414 start_codon:yes stop_codon:yes gene_type:complete
MEDRHLAQEIRHAKQPGNTDRWLPRLQFYIVFTRRVRVTDDPFADIKDDLPAHLDWIREQEEKGVLFMAGPFRDDSYWEGDGMFIFKVASAEIAAEIAATCPLHKSGKRTFEVTPWQFNEGQITLSVKQAAQEFTWS